MSFTTLSRSRGAVPLVALLLAIGLLSIAVAAAAAEHGKANDSRERILTSEAREHAGDLEHYFSRARSLTLVTSRNPAFRDFYEAAGERRAKVKAGGREVTQANEALSYLEELFKGSIGEACFIDLSGSENARAVRGEIAPLKDLSDAEASQPFFKPGFRVAPGEVYQAPPYLSPDTNDWVVANVTPIAMRDGSKPAIVHFEVTLESFREEATETSGDYDIAIVEAKTGKVIADSRYKQPAGPKSNLGPPRDRRFAQITSIASKAFGDGTIEIGGRESALQRIERTPNNANDWIVVASARAGPGTLLSEFGVLEITMASASLLLLGFALMSFRTSQQRLHDAALTDPLTGLPNRRSLMADLDSSLAEASHERPLLLGLFDLDGFKSYNDGFGHSAGDSLLERLGGALAAAMESRGRAYRMGGDEFCVLASVNGEDLKSFLDGARDALSEHGEGFSITASYGSILLPTETSDPAEALRGADQRMYAHKASGRASAGRQATDALVRVLAERNPDLGDHMSGVTSLCTGVADQLGLADEERRTLLQAAELRDIGKAAIPDAILHKPGPLDDEELAFMRQHTIIGERILGAAPALSGSAKLVRWSHERADGSGYPDGLSGDEIPMGARIIAVCDCYDAMISSRAYRAAPMSHEGAVAELRRCAGSQFDARVVNAFVAAVKAHTLVTST